MTANRHTPALYTAAEAAEILKVKRSWLERQAAARKIPFTMLGGAYKFTDGHLATIIQMHENMPSASGKRGSRPRSRRARLSVPVAGNGVTVLRPRPRTRQADTDVTGPSAAFNIRREG
jgi:excisionase family DNA binding protein